MRAACAKRDANARRLRMPENTAPLVEETCRPLLSIFCLKTQHIWSGDMPAACLHFFHFFLVSLALTQKISAASLVCSFALSLEQLNQL